MGECFLKKRLMISILAGGLMAAMLPGVVAAAPPDKSEIPFTIQHLDLENELVTFGNLGRGAYCTTAVVQWEGDILAWLEGGMVGAPPAEPAFPDGLKPIPVQTKATGKGAIVASARGSGLYVELWGLEDDPPFVGPCTDTDDGDGLFAKGTMRFQGKDNDFDGSGTRGNAFGDQGRATVTDTHGDKYRYSWLFRLNDRCYTPDDGPPVCLIDTSTLRARN
jgi:hypothetical protein